MPGDQAIRSPYFSRRLVACLASAASSLLFVGAPVLLWVWFAVCVASN